MRKIMIIMFCLMTAMVCSAQNIDNTDERINRAPAKLVQESSIFPKNEHWFFLEERGKWYQLSDSLDIQKIIIINYNNRYYLIFCTSIGKYYLIDDFDRHYLKLPPKDPTEVEIGLHDLDYHLDINSFLEEFPYLIKHRLGYSSIIKVRTTNNGKKVRMSKNMSLNNYIDFNTNYYEIDIDEYNQFINSIDLSLIDNNRKLEKEIKKSSKSKK